MMFQNVSSPFKRSGEMASSGEVIEAVFNRDSFAAALVAVSATLSDSEVDWVQLNFLGENRVELSSGSHNISIKFELTASYQGTGVIKVNGKQLSDYVKQLPSEKLRMIAQLPQQLMLKCGSSTARMQLVQDASFNNIFVPEVGTQILAQADYIERWVNSFKDFVAVDDTRFYANGALIWAEQDDQVCLNAVASDALRLAKSKLLDGFQIQRVDSGAVLVPKKAIEELKRVCAQSGGQEIRLKWSSEGQFFAVETESYLMISKCIAGKYPPYTSAIPKEINLSVNIDTRSLLESVRRVMLFADKNRIIKLNFDGPVLDVQSFTPGQREGEDIIELPAPVEKPFQVNFNGSLLMGILMALNGGVLKFAWEDVNRPVQVTGDQEKGIEVFYLLVPTRF